MSSANLLLMTAASIAFIHTLLGPDHYLPFTAIAKARNWSMAKTLRVVFLCGLGHVLSSVLLGLIGIAMGAKLSSLVAIEGTRGNLAGWALLAFGIVYLIWGLRRAGRSHTHSHAHSHGDVVHEHAHSHAEEHVHVHADAKGSITPWALFIIFVLGPCEALIPLFMYPAAQQSPVLVVSVAAVFGIVTLATMMTLVAVTIRGLKNIRWRGGERYAHAVAGGSVVLCGVAVNFAGL